VIRCDRGDGRGGFVGSQVGSTLTGNNISVVDVLFAAELGFGVKARSDAT